jgi:hypothetical protein
VMLYIRVLKAESGEGDPMESNNEEKVEIKVKPLPSCGVVTNSMDAPTWTNLVKDFGKVFEKTSSDLKNLDVEMNDNVSLFVQLQLASMYEQIYSCLPQFIKHPEGGHYEDYMEDEDTSEKPDKEEEVVTGLINKVKKVLEKVKTAISAWETKDSVLLLFTTPGILSALVLLLQLCLKRRMKKYSQELRNRNRS